MPRNENGKADVLYKIIERDDCDISQDIISISNRRWGSLDIDYFASEYNAKWPHVYSRFWCNRTSGVDAFTYDWSKGCGIVVPPIT